MRRALVILLLSLTCGAAAPSPSADAVEELMRARSFCMGCEAFAGRIISADDAFMAVLKRKTAAADLQRVLEHGTREAKMYALAGLREIDRPRFAADFARVRAGYGSVTVVLTEDPPSVLRRSAAEVLRNIRAGMYRDLVQWMRKPHEPLAAPPKFKTPEDVLRYIKSTRRAKTLSTHDR